MSPLPPRRRGAALRPEPESRPAGRAARVWRPGPCLRTTRPAPGFGRRVSTSVPRLPAGREPATPEPLERAAVAPRGRTHGHRRRPGATPEPLKRAAVSPATRAAARFRPAPTRRAPPPAGSRAESASDRVSHRSRASAARAPAAPLLPIATATFRRRPLHPGPGHRPLAHGVPQPRVGPAPQFDQGGPVEGRPGLPRRVVADRRPCVVRTHLLADVASVDVRPPDRRDARGGIGPFVSMVRLGQASRGVEHPRLGQGRRWGTPRGTACRRRTGRRAGASGSRATLHSTSDRNSHDPASALMRHVFLPIHPRPAYCAVHPLLHGAGVDVDAGSRRARRAPRPSTPPGPGCGRRGCRGNRRPTRNGRSGPWPARRSRSSRAGRCCRACRAPRPTAPTASPPGRRPGGRRCAPGTPSRRRSPGRASRAARPARERRRRGRPPHRSNPSSCAFALTASDVSMAEPAGNRRPGSPW